MGKDLHVVRIETTGNDSFHKALEGMVIGYVKMFSHDDIIELDAWAHVHADIIVSLAKMLATMAVYPSGKVELVPELMNRISETVMNYLSEKEVADDKVQ